MRTVFVRLFALLALLALTTGIPAADPPAGPRRSPLDAAGPARSIHFTLERPGRTSLAVFSADGDRQLRALLVGERLAAGPHMVRWDGLDRDGRPVEPGEYRWKLVSSPGIEADYLGAIGVNPKAGGWTKWVGNHYGPTTIAVGSQGVCIAGPIAEGPPNIHLFEPDFATSRWHSPHLGWSSIGTRSVALTDQFVVGLGQDARATVRNVKTGDVVATFDVLWSGDARPDHEGGQGYDLDAHGDRCVVSHFAHDALRWYELPGGKLVREVAIAKPQRVASGADGSVWALAEPGVVRIGADDRRTVVVDAGRQVAPVALAWDASNRTLLVANGEPDRRILRFSADGELLKTYGALGGRRPGPYLADRFAEVADLAADRGRFYVVEGGTQGGLRRIALVGEAGEILDERFGGAEFFSCAAAVPGNPREVYYSSSPRTLGRYDFDPKTGRSRLTHLFQVPERSWGDGLFPTPFNFPHYRPVVRRGQVYLVSNGRYLLRPEPGTGELIPVALAAFRPNHGWPKDRIPEPIARAVAFHRLDIDAPATDAFTWSDVDGDGRLDPEEFRFAETGPGAGYAFLDADFNLLFGHYHAPNHTWTGKRWINFEFRDSLYATVPNEARDGAAPVWDWSKVERSEEKLPPDPLGVLKKLSPRAVHRAADGRVDVFFDGGGGGHHDLHVDVWPTAQTTHTRIISARDGRITHVVGKHASEGPPRDAQFGMPSHLLGTVAGNLIVCDRMQHTTAWTPDGLLIGTLLDRHVQDELPDVHYVAGGKDGEFSVIMGDDWMSAGSISDLGDGQALWFAPGGDRAIAFKLRGFHDLHRQTGTIEAAEPPPAAPLDGDGLKAEYFATADLSGPPVVTRIDPRLWFAESTVGGQIVAAWTKDGPCPGIGPGKPFSVRWTGSLAAPFSEPFWLRIYNARPGLGHTPIQQAWQEGKGAVRVWLNNQLVLDKWYDSPATNPWQTPPLMLQAGTTYDLRVEYSQQGVAAPQFSLSWCSYTGEWMRVPTPYLRSAPSTPRPRLSVAAVQPAATEREAKPGVVRFTLDRPVERDVEIPYRLEGAAKLDVDYRIVEPRAVIRAGSTSTDLTIVPLDDRQLEAHERCAVTLAPSGDLQGDGGAGRAVVEISDDDNVLVDADLKVYYSFDELAPETSSIRNDAGPDHAALMRTYGAPPAKPATGRPDYGSALHFPTGRERVESASKLELGDYTVSFWFRTKRPDTGICMAGSTSFFLKDGALQVVHGGWPSSQPAGTNLADDAWRHAAFVWHSDARQQKLYLDGRLIATNVGPGGGAGLAGVVTLGMANGGGSFTDGRLDEFRLYARRLDDAQIETLANWRK